MNSLKPKLILVANWSYDDEGVRFYLAGTSYKYEGLAPDLVSKIVEKCNGLNTEQEIVNSLEDDGWNRSDLEKLIDSLKSNQIVMDSSYVIPYFRNFISNPPPFGLSLSEEEIVQLILKDKDKTKNDGQVISLKSNDTTVKKLTSKRESVREFSGESITKDNLSDILWSLYGKTGNKKSFGEESVQKRTVPSAGMLYPLKFHLALFEELEGLNKGIYQITFQKSEVNLSLINPKVDDIFPCFVDPLPLNNAQGVVIISADISRTAEKYGNRSIKFCYIEAGHSVENMLLQAVESGVDTCEIGGFFEEDVSETLGLAKENEPITTVVFGKKNQGKDEDKSEVVLEWGNQDLRSLGISTNMLFGRFTSGDSSWCSGKDQSPKVAFDKLISELVEWHSFNFPSEVISKPGELDLPYLNPKKVLNRGARDHSELEVSEFKEDQEYGWIKGTNLEDNSSMFVLSDLVLFPYSPDYSKYFNANSSGCAAHKNKDAAIGHALFELVERDAFMIWWLNKLDCPTIERETLPRDISSRVEVLESLGYEILFKNLTLDIAPVIMVAARKRESVFLCSLSSHTNLKKCLDRLLGELEVSVMMYEKYGGETPEVKLTEVRHPKDHGNLYKVPKFVEKTKFVFSSKKTVSLQDIRNTNNSIRNVLNKKGHKVVIIDVSKYQPRIRNTKKRSVIRTIVPGLVPITFGYEMEPLGMKRVKSVPEKLGLEGLMVDKYNMIPHPLD